MNMHPLDQRPHFNRFSQWYKQEIWEDMHQQIVTDPDTENLTLDCSVIQANPCSAGD